MMRVLIALWLAMVAMSAAGAEQLGDPKEGQRVFKSQCSSCHMVGEGSRNRIGPHLNGVVGRAVASLDGVKYSKSLRRLGAEGLEWRLNTLDAYIADPKVFARGTRMNYRGLKNEEQRSDLLAYLQTYSANTVKMVQTNTPQEGTADVTMEEQGYSVAPDILAIVGDVEYGAYLASECLTCHKMDGTGDGIPSITNWPADDFVLAMHAYKDKVRPHPVMQMMAGRLNDEEIAALAAYFETLGN